MKKTSQKGFAHLGLFVLLLVVIVVALIGYKVAKGNKTTPAVVNTTIPTTAVQGLPVVKSTADLNTIESTLNNQNIDGNLNPGSFDQDTQSLL
jgi:cytochrome b561